LLDDESPLSPGAQSPGALRAAAAVAAATHRRAATAAAGEGVGRWQVKFFIDSVTIIVVAVPEGLPLAVTISLAYSVKRMQADMNLVRVMAACETMGGATTVCSDKTGTLTQNLMTVSEGFFAGRFWPAPPTRADLEVGYFEVLAQGISVNSRAELGGELPGGRPEVIGNKTEGAMLAFIRAVGADYRAERTQANVARTFPFSSLKKRMSTLLRRSGNDGRLHCKGASEVIAEGCDSYLASDGSRQPLTDSVREEVAGHIATMAGRGLRTLGLAVADVDDVGGVAGLEDAPAPEMRMTLVAVIGIRDPPREASSPSPPLHTWYLDDSPSTWMVVLYTTAT
jgi:P-type Ca2+ transporter type 2C